MRCMRLCGTLTVMLLNYCILNWSFSLAWRGPRVQLTTVVWLRGFTALTLCLLAACIVLNHIVKLPRTIQNSNASNDSAGCAWANE
jgi:hypothetical protein